MEIATNLPTLLNENCNKFTRREEGKFTGITFTKIINYLLMNLSKNFQIHFFLTKIKCMYDEPEMLSLLFGQTYETYK